MADRDKNSNLKSRISNLRSVFDRMVYYFRIWLIMSKNSFLMVLTQKKVILIFLIGKILRFIFFFSFLYFLLKETNGLAGYNSNQTLFFFLTFMVVDVTSQFLFREVYRFRPLVVSGDLDLLLVKPSSTLFRVLMGGADIIDFMTLPPLYWAVFYYGRMLNPKPQDILFYLVLITTGLLISTAFHIFVLSMGVITLEIDHLVMVYRDLLTMGRFPVDIYKEPLKSILTYFIPVGLMMSVPAKALIGLIQFPLVLLIVLFSGLLLYLSLRFWQFALKHYTSASS